MRCITRWWDRVLNPYLYGGVHAGTNAGDIEAQVQYV